MTYTISWHIPARVVHVLFTDDVTETDLIDSSEDLYSLLVQSEVPVHILYNGTGIVDFPDRMTTVKRALRRFTCHPAMGWLIFAGFSTPDLRYVSNAIMQVMMRNFKNVHSLEDVDIILEQIDSSLETRLVRTSI